jgi:biotin carboxyl carrier protein
MAVGSGGRDYVAVIDGRQRQVRITPDGDGLCVLVDGEEFLVGQIAYGDGEFCLLLDDRPEIVQIRDQKRGKYRVTLTGGEVAVEIADPIVARIRRAAGPAAAEKRIEMRSPMPGTVVLVNVREGEEVEADVPLVVLEAMKMQNALVSTAPGIVREVFVEPGQSVEGEALLVVLDRKADA